MNNVSIYLFSFILFLRPFQDNFNSYERGQSVGAAKTDGPREKKNWLIT